MFNYITVKTNKQKKQLLLTSIPNNISISSKIHSILMFLTGVSSWISFWLLFINKAGIKLFEGFL